MFTRRGAVFGMALQFAASTFHARAATSSPPKRMGILSRGNLEDQDNAEFERALFEFLRAKGWTEGRNLLVVRAYAGQDDDRLPALAQELVRSQVDLVLTGGPVTTIPAARATSKIPIVFSDPIPHVVEQGLIESFARPGRNVTGTTVDLTTGGKGTQYLRQLVPSARRLALLTAQPWTKFERVSGGFIDPLAPFHEKARAMGFESRDFVYRPGELLRTLAEIDQWRADAVTVSPQDWQEGVQVAEIALRRRLPSHFTFRKPVEAGGLLSWGPAIMSATNSAKSAASYIDRILRGADPASLPVEIPNQWELVINAKTAQALGLSIPTALQVTAEILR